MCVPAWGALSVHGAYRKLHAWARKLAVQLSVYILRKTYNTW